MKEKKNFIKKYILFVALSIIIIIAIYSNLLIRETTNLDEMWHFDIAKNIAIGLIPYKDISMITTPLMYIIEAIILKITVKEIIVARILAAILSFLIIAITYKILKKITEDKLISIITSLIITVTYLNYFTIEYNYVILFIALIIIYGEICNNKKDDIIIGILAGLAICTKQTIGLAIAGICIIKPLLYMKKTNKKEMLISATHRIYGIAIPTIIFLIYLIFNEAFQDFISYCIIGVKYFNNTISYKGLLENKNLISVFATVLPLIFVISLIDCILQKTKEIKSEKIQNIENCTKTTEETNILNKIAIVVLYSIPLMLIIYPIADDSHFVIASYTLIIIFVYYLKKVIERIYGNEKIKIAIEIAIIVFLSLMLIFIGGKNLILYKNCNDINTNIEVFKHLRTPEYLSKRTEAINNTRKKYGIENVYILDSEAVVYDLAENQYHKNFDMFNKGNLGKDGEDGIIKQIQSENGKYYMVKKEGVSLNWQTPVNIIEYIRKNLKKIDTVDIYDIFIKEQ